MARIRAKRLWAVALFVGMVALLLVPVGATTAAPTPKVGTMSSATIERVGTTNVRELLQAARTAGGGAAGSRLQSEVGPWLKSEGEAGAEPNVANAPSPESMNVVLHENRHGWEGLDHADQRLAGGGNQFSLEPPDQGLCVGNVSPNDPAFGPEVVESVNDALVFYDGVGEQFSRPITLSSFFGLPPTINRTTGEFGPFISDPKCYFDPDTERWFHTVLTINQNPNTGAFTTPAAVYIAVSQSEEALGSYYIYRIKTTDRGHENCPCFGDQPLIGADKYGFYVSTAEYDLKPFGGHFNGPQIYAMSKTALENGTLPVVKHLQNIQHNNAGRTTGTVQPATSPDGTYDESNGGTQYFLSSYDCDPENACAIIEGEADQITIWGLTNTQSLNNPHPHLHLTLQDILVSSYENPPGQHQKNGFRPLGELVGEPTPEVEANDARMNQVVLADGHLWSGLNTAVNPGPRAGIEWFVVDPSIVGGAVNGTIHAEGYVAAENANVSFPSIGVTGDGHALMAMSLMGPNNFPSAAQVRMDENGPTGDIEIVRRGFRPEDGFTCYMAFIGGPTECRWGDYTASVGTPDGQIWSAVEFIGDNSRTFFANWSTFVWPVNTGG